MRYTKIVNGTIEKISGSPGWLDDNGVPLTDEVYIRDHSIYPITEPHKGDDGYIEQDMDKWVIEADKVTVAYYTVIDSGLKSTRLDTTITKLPQTEWVYDDVMNTTTIQYITHIKTDEEMLYIIDNHMVTPSYKDSSIYEEKPRSEWLFDGFTVHKTYYTIVIDPDRDQYSDIFYDVTIADRSSWVVVGDDIQEKCIFMPKTDLAEIKNRLNDVIAEYRWRVETGGMMFNEYIISTDRESQLKVLAKYTIVSGSGAVDNIVWKTQDGFISFTSVDFLTMCLAVESFVNESYNQEHLLYNDLQGSQEQLITFDILKAIFDRVDTSFTVNGSVFLLNKEG